LSFSSGTKRKSEEAELVMPLPQAMKGHTESLRSNLIKYSELEVSGREARTRSGRIFSSPIQS